MFRVEDNVPEVYVNKSRDFQLLARLYDLVLQSSRFSIDTIPLISDTHNCNNKVLPLLGTKVGFFTNLELPDNVYRQVISAFPHIIKYKGSFKGLQLIANLFSRIENTYVDVVTTEDGNIEFRFSDYFEHKSLLDNLLAYVCPTGMVIKSYRVISRAAHYDITTTDNVGVSNVGLESDFNSIPDPDTEDTTSPEIGFTLIRHKIDQEQKSEE